LHPNTHKSREKKQMYIVFKFAHSTLESPPGPPAPPHWHCHRQACSLLQRSAQRVCPNGDAKPTDTTVAPPTPTGRPRPPLGCTSYFTSTTLHTRHHPCPAPHLPTPTSLNRCNQPVFGPLDSAQHREQEALTREKVVAPRACFAALHASADQRRGTICDSQPRRPPPHRRWAEPRRPAHLAPPGHPRAPARPA